MLLKNYTYIAEEPRAIDKLTTKRHGATPERRDYCCRRHCPFRVVVVVICIDLVVAVAVVVVVAVALSAAVANHWF